MKDFFLLGASALMLLYKAPWCEGAAVVREMLEDTPTEHRTVLLHIDTIGDVIYRLAMLRKRGRLSAEKFEECFSHVSGLRNHPGMMSKIAAESKIDMVMIDLFVEYDMNFERYYVFRCAIEKAQELALEGHRFTLVSCDTQLIAALRAQGIVCLNPKDSSEVTV